MERKYCNECGVVLASDEPGPSHAYHEVERQRLAARQARVGVLTPPRPDVALPAAPSATGQTAQVWGVVALVAGILSVIVLPIVLGPVAIIAGSVALTMKSRMGWWGIGLGAVAVGLVAYNLVELQNELSNLGI